MSSKVQYLISENEQLKEQVDQLEHMLKLNKQALQIAMNNNPSQNNNNTSNNKNKQHLNQTVNIGSQNSTQITTQQNITQDNKSSQALNKVISSLYEENNNQQEQINKLTEERNLAQSKSLVHEQMYEDCLRQKQELVDDIKQERQLNEQKINQLELQIHQLEKEKPVYDHISGIVVKYRDVVSLNEQTIVLHEEIERLNYIIVKQAKDIHKQKEICDDLNRINFQLSQQIIQQKARQFLPNNPVLQQQQQQQQQQQMIQKQKINGQANLNLNLGGLGQNNNNNDQNQDNQVINIQNNQFQQSNNNQIEDQQENQMDKSAQILVNFQKKLFNNDSDSDSDDFEKDCLSPMMSPLPDKVQNNQTLQTQGPQVQIKQLDLTRAYQIQDLVAKKQTQIQLQKEGAQRNIEVLKEKYAKAEYQLNQCRKNLAREMIITKQLSLQNDELSQQVEDLLGNNEILINSNQQYEAKWKDIYHSYCYYRDFYQEYKDKQMINNSDIKNMNPDKIIRQRKRNDKSQFDSSVLQVDQNVFNNIHQQQINDYNLKNNNNQYMKAQNYFGKEQAQNYLISMAADLYNQMQNFEAFQEQQENQNYQDKINSLNKKRKRIQRSNSNPIDYIPDPIQDDLYQVQVQKLHSQALEHQNNNYNINYNNFKNNIYNNNNNINNNNQYINNMNRTEIQFNQINHFTQPADVEDMEIKVQEKIEYPYGLQDSD